MIINNERDLEDYICNNIEDFIKFLKSIYGEDEKIEFVGRQIVIGDSRIDLLFQIIDLSEDQYIDIAKTFIVVELKFRNAETKDVAQLARYMNLLHDLELDERIGSSEIFVKGILLTTGLGYDMQEIQMYLNNWTDADITFVQLKTNITYQVDKYSRKEEYINTMQIDNRMIDTKEDK